MTQKDATAAPQPVELRPPVATIYDENGTLCRILVSDTQAELDLVTSVLPVGHTRIDVPRSLYESQNVAAVAALVPAAAVQHVISVKTVSVAQLPPSIIDTLFTTYGDQLKALPPDKRLIVRQYLSSFPTNKNDPTNPDPAGALTAAAFRAGGIVLRVADDALADTAQKYVLVPLGSLK